MIPDGNNPPGRADPAAAGHAVRGWRGAGGTARGNIGPNLTYTGSLAILRHRSSEPDLTEFTRLGLLTVPAALVLGVLALWAGLRLLGG